jgi:hypothetical protein
MDAPEIDPLDLERFERLVPTLDAVVIHTAAPGGVLLEMSLPWVDARKLHTALGSALSQEAA